MTDDPRAAGTPPTDTPPADVDVEAVRERLLDEHGELLDAVLSSGDTVLSSGDAVASDAESDTRTAESDAVDGRTLARRLEAELVERGVHGRLPAVLETAVAAAGLALAAEPVAAPPYVTVTSRGPVLRGPTAAGRLVVTVAVFRVERDPVRYVRCGGDPGGCVTVAFKRRPGG